jgi:hypothetical protein
MAVFTDLPNIIQWTPWLPLTDNEVILEGATVSLPLVQCFLSIHRGWTEDDIHGRRFHVLVQDVTAKLLKEKELERAKFLLEKVVCIFFRAVNIVLLNNK